ncbi:MAG: cation diffusion facilitator family transporter [Parasphingopyxis sp.]|nr:cation diffusion facilitator family transporter [Sphingomonadales bacterium]
MGRRAALSVIGSLNTRAALASVATAVFLLGLKAYATWMTGSVAMLGSLADTGLDLLASLVTFIAVRIAATPADAEHRFGHGKAEALAAMFQVTLISLSALAIGYRAVERWIAGAETANAEYGIGVSVIAIIATLVLIVYQRSVIRRTNSLAISADNVHYQSDLLLNASVIAALVIDQYLGFASADPIFGIAIALYLAWGAFRTARRAVAQLMDREWADERRDRLIEIANSHPASRGIHDLRTWTSGVDDFAQFHIWVDPKMTVEEAHRVMDEIERLLLAEFPDTDILIHPDPEGHVEPHGGVLPVDLAREPQR